MEFTTFAPLGKCGTSLHEAILVGGVQQIREELWKHGDYINVPDAKGRTPLHLAVLEKRSVHVIRELLAYGAHVNSVDNYGRIPLLSAICQTPVMQNIRELLANGSDTTIADFEGYTPLRKALYENYEMVTELVKCGVNVNVTFDNGWTPLIETIYHLPYAEGAVTLLKHGAKVNVVDRQGNSPLLAALYRGRGEGFIKLLLEHGADPCIVNKEGKVPLDIALVRYRNNLNEVPVIIGLLKHGAKSNMNSETCNRLLSKLRSETPDAKILIKHTLIQNFKVHRGNLYNLKPHEEHRDFYNSIAHYIEDCVSEILQMETMELRHGLSLNHFVTSANRSAPLYLDNGITERITQDGELITSYPIYSDVILPLLEYALRRGKLLSKLSEVPIYSRKRNGSANGLAEKVVLNYDSASLITEYLPINNDLLNFVLAFCNFNLDNYELHGPAIALEWQKVENEFGKIPAGNCIKKTRLE